MRGRRRHEVVADEMEDDVGGIAEEEGAVPRELDEAQHKEPGRAFARWSSKATSTIQQEAQMQLNI